MRPDVPPPRRAPDGERPHGVVHLESGGDVVVIEGVAERVRDPGRLRRFVESDDRKHERHFDPEEIAPRRLLGVAPCRVLWLDGRSPGFDGTAIRWRFGKG